MITSEQRNGKYLHELSMMELVEEYMYMNIEGTKLVTSTLGLNLSEDQKKILNEKCEEFDNYKKRSSVRIY